MSTFDQIYNNHDAGEAHPVFGPTTGCPECHRTEGELWVNRQQVQYCATHQVYWLWSLTPICQDRRANRKGPHGLDRSRTGKHETGPTLDRRPASRSINHYIEVSRGMLAFLRRSWPQRGA